MHDQVTAMPMQIKAMIAESPNSMSESDGMKTFKQRSSTDRSLSLKEKGKRNQALRLKTAKELSKQSEPRHQVHFVLAGQPVKAINA
jgi:hypothetical protein